MSVNILIYCVWVHDKDINAVLLKKSFVAKIVICYLFSPSASDRCFEL